MEASVKIALNTANLNRHLSPFVFNRYPLKTPFSKLSLPSQNPRTGFSPQISFTTNPLKDNNDLVIFRNTRRSISLSRSSISPSNRNPNPNPVGFLLSLSLSHIFSPRGVVSEDRLDSPVSDPNERFFEWKQGCRDVNGGDLGLGFSGEEGPLLTVVLLGWLGAEHKHLKRYAEMYTSRGIRAVSFVVPVKGSIVFDLGKGVQKRIAALSEQLLSWLSKTEEDGRERNLLFHTFSNTGWLTYGAILENLQFRGDFFEKIKGCVIDSGADHEINPQVWAAGFSTALLKKRNPPKYSSVEANKENAFNGDTSRLQMHDNTPSLIEVMLLSILEKFFTIFLRLPYVDRRLSKIIAILSENQPPCPQLYLYSSADKVIPVQSVECFIQEQRKLGRKVWAYNFGSSPHVDHLRSFPHIYSAEIHKFLRECIAPVGHSPATS